ncbi:uncharacterized protein LOC100893893 [Strongylocentrotus purpuratus]|uniref:Uncharacterized protein n=1 Tax=Strongylocentrotus purpuratus TaxID=7668 RepID=A0A7M7GLL2_STRPU|nr:uncharacterized protein LOC100893893 [Strongylocentrotus purpuratus]
MIESSHGRAFREIFVQYIPGKPLSLTEFGALLYSRQGGHEFRALDGTGLARTVGLRNCDELLSINNLQSDISSANQLAVLECFSDIGTQIGLVIKRKQEETWLFAFHLYEKGNRPVVENIFSVILDNSRTPVIPVESAFRVNPVYSYDSSLQVQMILQQKEDRFMEIDNDKATYVLREKTVTINKYRRIYGSDDGIPVSISTPESSVSDSDNESDSECGKDEKSMCIKAVDVGPLKVVDFPPHMTRRGEEILQNNMFFIHYFIDNGASVFKAANTEKDLFISTDEDYDRLWVASLQASASKFSTQ